MLIFSNISNDDLLQGAGYIGGKLCVNRLKPHTPSWLSQLHLLRKESVQEANGIIAKSLNGFSRRFPFVRSGALLGRFFVVIQDCI